LQTPPSSPLIQTELALPPEPSSEVHTPRYPYLDEETEKIGIVGGIIGFVIVALLITSVVLYVLVRRSVERRARDREFLRESKDYGGESRSSVAASASDSPEDELREMEPSFWGVVTRPKQALRVVNG